MERTPEEIKKSLECSAAQADGKCEEYAACVCCPLFVEEDVSAEDIAAYIQRLEMLAKPNEQIRWERDVAVDQLRQLGIGFGEKVEAQVSKWISAEERLPEISDVVLVIASGKPRENIELHDAFLIASFWGDEGWIADGYEEWDAVNVTHWMPLPEPPKEG